MIIPLLYTIILIFIFKIVKLITPVVTYYKRKKEYEHIPKYNKKRSKAIMPSMLMSEDNGWYKMIDTLREEEKEEKEGKEGKEKNEKEGEEGKIRPIVHWGPFLDFSHTVAISDPNAIREVLINDDIYIKHPKLYEPLQSVVGDGIITAMNDNWKLQRKLLTPVFHFATLKSMIPDMNDEAQAMLREIRERRKKEGKEKRETIDVISLFNEVSLAVIIRIAFGNEFDFSFMKEQWNHIFHGLAKSCLFHSLVGSWWKHVPLPSIKNFESAKVNIREKCLEVIRKKRKQSNIEGSDLLSLMLRAERDLPDVISEEMIVNECVSFLMAGQDTVSSVLSWTIYHLSKNKDVQKKLQEEIDNVLQGRPPTESDLPKLKFTKQVFDEVLRFNPGTSTLSRLCTSDQELCGKRIPKGTSVVVMLNGVAMSEDHWVDPSSFNPDRFSEEAKQTTRHAYASVAFSAGNRNCIGQKFATQEYIILLSSLIQNFIIEVDESYPFVVRFEIAPVPVGLRARFVERKK